MLQVLGIELTTRCNLHCAHCLQQRGGADDLPLALLQGLLGQLAPYGRPVIGLTGGEPTLHPRFLDIARLIAGRGHPFYVVTNAQTFETIAPALTAEVRGALTGFSFSLESPDEAEHDAIRGEGNYRRVLMALAWTAASGLEASVQTMLTPRSVPRLDELVALCASLNVRALYLSHLIPTPSALAAGLVLSLDERAAAEAAVRRIGTERGVAVRMGVGCADPSPLLTCPLHHRRAALRQRPGSALSVLPALAHHRPRRRRRGRGRSVHHSAAVGTRCAHRPAGRGAGQPPARGPRRAFGPRGHLPLPVLPARSGQAAVGHP